MSENLNISLQVFFPHSMDPLLNKMAAELGGSLLRQMEQGMDDIEPNEAVRNYRFDSWDGAAKFSDFACDQIRTGGGNARILIRCPCGAR